MQDLERSIPEHFEARVHEHPDRIAVKASEAVLTYETLNRAANRVARAVLATRGSAAEPIGLLFEQGAAAIVAILAMLKAGKIFVPLDPAFPRARITSMLDDAQVGGLVTQTKHILLATTLAPRGCPTINIDEVDARHSSENVDLPLSPDHLAYIVYTSGSTGRPKGVVQNHRNLLHQVARETTGLHIHADDRRALLRSCSVVGGTRAILSAVLNGASIHPFNVAERGLIALATWLRQDGITIYDSVATVFRHFAATLTGEEQFPALRLIRVGSEPVYRRDVDLYKRHFAPGCLFVSSLGRTEAGWVRDYCIDKAALTEQIVPVGYPVEGVDILLVDEAGAEVGADEVGEIVVKSQYLAVGYWRQPEMTRAAFTLDPAGGTARLYHTGDLGRMRADGCLEHLGRKDFQVKVRGYRIEVAEIERALLECAGIKEAVVLAREDHRREQHLVAYLVATGDPPPSGGILRRTLAETLPGYMIPFAFVGLPALPLTPTGKVDRLALPAPESLRAPATAVAEARTSVEQVLAGIWADVLGLDRVGLHDHFLDLGGESLRATQIAARVWDTFRLQVPVPLLFGEASTVADMAAVIAQYLDAPHPPNAGMGPTA